MKKIIIIAMLLFAPSIAFSAQQTILGGSGVTWGDEKVKVNANFTEVYGWESAITANTAKTGVTTEEANETMDAVPTNGNADHTASSDGIHDALALKQASHDYLTDIVGLTPTANNLLGWNAGATDIVNISQISLQAVSSLEFEGATADDYEATIQVVDPVVDVTWPLPYSKYDATTAPGVTNDLDEGYSVGSIWVDVTADNSYQAQDVTDGAAVWVSLDPDGAGGGTVASSAEINTGTDNTKFVSPDALAGSYAFTKEIGWTIVDSDTAITVADGKQAAVIPASMVGMNLIDVTCSVHDLNSAASGTTTVVLRRVRGATAADMTSTGVTIAYDGYTASDETVDTSNDDLALGDKVYPDVNAITTAAQKGLSCTALFQLP